VCSCFRTAFTELSVLGDILNICQQKRYLVLDPVSSEAPDSRPAATLMYKKKVGYCWMFPALSTINS
jgi:hypothetical protein